MDPEFKSYVLKLFFPIYLPSLLINVTQGIQVPVLPLLLKAVGASNTTAGLTFALTGLGKALADIPAGTLARRYGHVPTMVLATAVYGATCLFVFFVPTVWGVLLSCVLWGVSLGLFSVARGSYMSDAVTTKDHRGRLTSLLGGSGRLAAAIGPIIGGGIAHYVSFRMALLSQVPMLLGALWSLMFCSAKSLQGMVTVTHEAEGEGEGDDILSDPDVDVGETNTIDDTEMVNDEFQIDTSNRHVPIPMKEELEEKEDEGAVLINNTSSQQQHLTLWQTFLAHRHFFFTVGLFNCLMFMPRTARKLILPLGGAALHMNPRDVGIVTSLSWTLDASFFWTSGLLMDKLGRKWSGIPSNIVLGSGFMI
eukprot:PhF_6_TR25257/c0_g1_i2/m.34788